MDPATYRMNILLLTVLHVLANILLSTRTCKKNYFGGLQFSSGARGIKLEKR